MATTYQQGERERQEPALGELRPGNAAALPPGTVEISILDILLVLARRRRLIVWCMVVSTFAGLVISTIFHPVFKPRTVILPPQQSGSGVSGIASELSSLGALGSLAGGSLGIKNQADMYVALFKSETVEDALIKQFDLGHEYRSK